MSLILNNKNTDVKILSEADNVNAVIIQNENSQFIKASFKAKYKHEYKTIKVKVVDVEVEAISVQFKKNIDDAQTFDSELKPLVISSNHNEVITSDITLSEDFNSNWNDLQEFHSEIVSGDIAEGSRSCVNGHIKDGTYKITEVLASTREVNLLGSYDILLNQFKADVQLSQEDLELIYSDIYLRFPILDETAIDTLDSSNVINSANAILSRSYSSNHDQTKTVIKEIFNDSRNDIISDVLTIITLSIAKGDQFPNIQSTTHSIFNDVYYSIKRSDPLKIIHILNDKELDDIKPNHTVDIGGFYSTEYNTIVFQDKSSFIHEAAHAVMNIVFNNQAVPYYQNKDKVYNEYQIAIKSALITVTDKLGYSIDKHNKNNNLKDILNIVENESILDLIGYQNMQENSFKQISLSRNLMSKYFPNLDNREDLLIKVDELLEDKIRELNITSDDYSILCEIASIIYKYNQEAFDGEFIVRLPQLLSEGINMQVIDQYFGDLKQFWDMHIHSYATSLIENHANYCNYQAYPQSNFDSENTFAYCVEEYL